jgi:cellulose synthase/poly-beta-1,6-N-acetylglucosamine synthase-like glycosyltransferase
MVRLLQPTSPQPEPPAVPVRVLELALEEPLPALPAPTPDAPHRHALALIRLHGLPLGTITIAIAGDGLPADGLADEIWARLQDEIETHLRADGLAAPVRLTAAGLPVTPQRRPDCIRAREAFVDGAPPISVLIPSRERPERLRRCVESILAADYPAGRVHVIVVDNAPRTTATRDLVTELSARSSGAVTYVREDAPGSASARNRGLNSVQTELVAMTDDDVVVDRHWLSAVARAFAAHPEAGAVSGLLWPAELETQPQLWFEQYGGFSRGFEQRVFDLGENRPPGEPLYPWNAGLFGTGNNFSFRTATLREIGGFDPALGNGTPALGGVDSEVLLRMVLSGHQIVYEPGAIAHHCHRADYDGLRRQVYAYGTGLVAYYLKTVLADPRFALDFARKLPAGVRWMLSADSHINRHKLIDYPSELTWLERRGMVYGPLAYLRSRRRYGRHPVYRQRGARSALTA